MKPTIHDLIYDDDKFAQFVEDHKEEILEIEQDMKEELAMLPYRAYYFSLKMTANETLLHFNSAEDRARFIFTNGLTHKDFVLFPTLKSEVYLQKTYKSEAN